MNVRHVIERSRRSRRVNEHFLRRRHRKHVVMSTMYVHEQSYFFPSIVITFTGSSSDDHSSPPTIPNSYRRGENRAITAGKFNTGRHISDLHLTSSSHLLLPNTVQIHVRAILCRCPFLREVNACDRPLRSLLPHGITVNKPSKLELGRR